MLFIAEAYFCHVKNSALVNYRKKLAIALELSGDGRRRSTLIVAPPDHFSIYNPLLALNFVIVLAQQQFRKESIIGFDYIFSPNETKAIPI